MSAFSPGAKALTKLAAGLLVTMAPGQVATESLPRHERLKRCEAQLRSPNPGMRLLAVRALGVETGDLPARLLTEALEDESIPVRLQAMDSLVQVGRWRERAAPVLTKLLQHANAAVRERARATLVAIGVMDALPTAHLVSVLQRSEEPSIALVQELGHRRKDAPLVVPELGALLARTKPNGFDLPHDDRIDIRHVFWPVDRVEHWRQAALAALLRLGPDAVAARSSVVAMTWHAEAGTRGRALRTLAALDPWDAETDRVLIQATADEVPYVRACAYVEAVFLSIRRGAEGETLAGQVERHLHGEQEEGVRAMGLTALELREPPPMPTGVPALLRGSDEERGIAELQLASEDVRIHGANLLAASGASDRAVQALRAVLVSSRDLPAAELVEGVGMAGVHLYLHTQGLPPRLADRCGRFGPGFSWFPGRACRPVPRLHSRLAAVRALGSYGLPAMPAVPELLRLTDDPAWRLREASLKALARIDARAVPATVLRGAEQDGYREVREAARELRRPQR